MDFYDMGFNGAEVGAIIQTPESIAAEIRTTSNIIHALNVDIEKSKVDETFKVNWRTFVAEWQEWYNAAMQSWHSWITRLWAASYDKTVEFRKRADDWRTEFLSRGGKTNAPKDKPPESPWAWAKPIVYGGLAVAGIYGLAKLVGAFQKPAVIEVEKAS